MARSAGSGIQLVAKDGDYATLRLPSGEMRRVLLTCRATVGQVGNVEHGNITGGKAGPQPLARQAPDRPWLGDYSCSAVCRYMKMITLPKLRDALRDMRHVVTVEPEIADRARGRSSAWSRSSRHLC